MSNFRRKQIPLTFQDELSKYTLAVPIQQDAPAITRDFVEVILKFEIPQMVLTEYLIL